MKTMTIIGLCTALSFSLFAQESEILVGKKGSPILPQKGDFGLGIDAVPILNFAGNMFNGTENNSFFVNAPAGVGIWGKYFLSDKMAIRGRLNTNQYRENFSFDVTDDADNSLIRSDQQTFGMSSLNLAAGLEWRRGNGRMQFIYGGEFIIGQSSTSTSYDYGNSFNSDNTVVTISDFNRNSPGEYQTGSRTLDMGSSSFFLGLRAFAGFEYFYAPKMSIGAEFGLTALFTSFAGGDQTVESWDAGDEIVVSETFQTTASGNSTSLGLNNLGGGVALVYLHFYFN